MTVKNKEINWETVQKASREAVTWARRRFDTINDADFSDVENELICFILDEKNSKRFSRYVYGDTTSEKVNKLVRAIIKDKSWFDLFFVDGEERVEAKYVAVYQLDKPSAKEIVKRIFTGDTIDTEAFHMINDKLRNTLTREQCEILEAVYGKSMTKTEAALHYGIHWRTVYKLIHKATAIAEREWLPIFREVKFHEWHILGGVWNTDKLSTWG